MLRWSWRSRLKSETGVTIQGDGRKIAGVDEGRGCTVVARLWVRGGAPPDVATLVDALDVGH
jgi:hypothetical protein